MEDSPYSIPNSIPPSLVVFSQSGYGDPIRMQRPFSSQVSDGKDGGLSGLSNLSPSSFGLRPMDTFPGLPAQLVHLQNPFLHPALESHRLQFGSSTGAFRPIVTSSSGSANSSHVNNNNNNNNHNHSGDTGSHNGPGHVKGIPSAFSAPSLSSSSRRKLDSIVESVMESRSREQQQAAASTSSSSAANAINLEKNYMNGQGGHHPHHPSQQQHRHRSISPVNSNSSPPQHQHPHHRLHHHHQQQHISTHHRKEERDGGDQEERDENMTPNSEMTDRSTPEDLTPPPANQQHQQSSKRRRKGNGCDGMSCPVCKMSLRPHDLEAHLLAEVEQLMCMSRLRRQQHMSRDEAGMSSADSPSSSMKKDGMSSEISQDSRWETYHRIRANRHSRLRIKTRRRREESGGSHVTCPVCQIPLQGSNEQFSAHVEACLRKNGDVMDEDEPVDIEGDGDTNDTDEYHWIHNRRINSRNPATAINMTTNSRRRDEDTDMLEVVVDGDETSTYGQPQYTEADVKAAAAMASSSSESSISQKEGKNRWGDHDESGGEDLSTSAGSSLSNHDNDNGGGNLLHVLQSKIQTLEQKLKCGVSSNCLICMDKYKKPVVSVSCWHVHCEHCWLKSLFTQKLCPQCNAITSASDLRRIFL